jgi:uncharacterized protein YsxB (DUF464 family)
MVVVCSAVSVTLFGTINSTLSAGPACTGFSTKRNSCSPFNVV